MKLSFYTALLPAAFLLAACGGSGDSQPGSDAAASSDDAVAVDDVGDGNSEGAPSVAFDAAALGSEHLNRVHVMPLDRSGPTPPPQVTPVVDTCAVLAASDFDAIVNQVATEFSFGEDPEFVATSLGAACDYSSETHVVRVLVGPADQVSTTAGSPGLFLPPGAGVLSEMVSPDDGAVSIVSEDSIGSLTPFAAFTRSGSYGVMVANVGGTGIDYGATGALYARLASAASAGVAGAPAPSAEADAQLENVAADPCSVWTIAELDAFFVDGSIERSNDGNVTDGCSWSSEQTLDQITLEAFAPGSAADEYLPIAKGSPISVSPVGDRIFVDTGDVVLRIQVSKEVVDSVFYDGTDAGIALAENILSRLN